MKRFLMLWAACALFMPALQSVRAADVSIDYFYDNLNGGNWYEVADYGYVWQPDVASNSNWRPYTDGYWAYTDVGWTWVSYEDFGWATYHYGRWARLADYGWVWVPGYDWGPAWVSWRTGGDYVGWAPLPPAGGEVVYEGQPIDYRVDAEYDIGPAYYNFIDLRYIGEPVLRDRIFPWDQNVVYVERTVNVTNITYNNGLVYNYGPDYGTLNSYSVRPIQRLRLERANVDPIQAVKMGNVTKVEGDRLVLAAPMKLQKAPAQLAPPKVKGKIEQPKLEKGWANVTDPSTKARLVQKFKSENPKNIPKPNIPPKGAANTANLNAPNAGPGAPASPGGSPLQGKGKGKGEKFQAGASVPPRVSPGQSLVPVGQAKGKKNKADRFESQAGVAPGTSPIEGAVPFEAKGKKNKGSEVRGQTMPGATPGVDQGGNQPLANQPARGKGNKNKGNEVRGQTTPGVGHPGNEPLASQPGGKGKKNKASEVRGQAMPAASTPGAGQPGVEPLTSQPGGGKGEPKGGRKREENVANQNVQPPGGAGNPPGEGKRNRQAERLNAQGNPGGPPPPPPQGFNAAGGGKRRVQVQGQAQGQPQPQGTEGKGKKSKGQPSPPLPPQ